MAYGNFIDLTRRETHAKMLRNKAFDITKIHKFDG